MVDACAALRFGPPGLRVPDGAVRLPIVATFA